MVGEDTAFPPNGESTRLSEIHDPLDQTIMVLERKDGGVHWAEPTDINAEQIELVGSDHCRAIDGWKRDGFFVISFVSGHTFILSTLSQEDILSAVNIRDGRDVKSMLP